MMECCRHFRRTRGPGWPRRPVCRAALGLLVVVLLAGCGSDGSGPSGTAGGGASARSSADGASAAAMEEAPLVVFLGDSLTAGLGLGEAEAFPARIEEELLDEGHRVEVINAGVSGDTSTGGLSRLDWLLSQDPEIVVVGLGANDGLRGLPVEATEENLRRIVTRSREAGAEVVLLGMKIPPSYGVDYAGRFEDLYRRIADDLDVPLVPFLLEGVAAKPALNLPDRIHPNARGHELIAETVYPYVEDALDEAKDR
ncbi:MAG: arylesterase [Thermoanaerobaculia bacterium]